MKRLFAPLFTVAAVLAAAPIPAAAGDFEGSSIEDWNKVPPPAREPRFSPPRPRKLTLRNGITLYVVENRSLPIFTMTLAVRGAGANEDPEGKSGLAALTADLLDEGAGQRSALELAETLAFLGADLSVYASDDEAVASLEGLSRNLDDTLAILVDVVTRPRFEDEDFTRVHGDRMTSIKLRPDNPRSVVFLVFQAALYAVGSPYHRPVAGLEADFATVTLDDVKAFHAAHWRPERMVIVAAGDFDADELRKRLDGTLGAWRPEGKRSPAPRPRAKAARIDARLLLIDRPGAAQTDLAIGHLGIDRKDRRYAAFEVMRTILGGAFTSRLNNRLREQLGYTYGIRASMWYRLGGGAFAIWSAIATPKTADALEEIHQIVDTLAREPVPPAELDKVKKGLIRELPAQFESNAGTVGAYLELALHGLPMNSYETLVKRIDRVTAKDVQRMARSFVRRKDFVYVLAGDLATIRADVEALGIGPVRLYDKAGQPLSR